MVLANEYSDSENEVFHCMATSTSASSRLASKWITRVLSASLPWFRNFTKSASPPVAL